MLRDLRKRLLNMEIKEPKVDIGILPAKDRYGAHWVKQQMVIEVFHQGIGGQGLLRQPAFKTIRVDKSVGDRGESPRAEKAGTKKPLDKAAKKTTAKKSAPLKVSHAERTVYGTAGI